MAKVKNCTLLLKSKFKSQNSKVAWICSVQNKVVAQFFIDNQLFE